MAADIVLEGGVIEEIFGSSEVEDTVREDISLVLVVEHEGLGLLVKDIELIGDKYLGSHKAGDMVPSVGIEGAAMRTSTGVEHGMRGHCVEPGVVLVAELTTRGNGFVGG